MSNIKTMALIDFAVMRSSIATTAGLSLVVAMALTAGMQSLTPAVAAVSAMAPLLLLTTLGAYDEYNNWGSFRLTLPLSRRDVVFGRYASLLAAMACAAVAALVFGAVVRGACALAPGALFSQLSQDATLARIAAATGCALSCSVAACAVTLPLALRFGMTKAVRFVPVVVAVAFALLLAIMGSSGSPLEGSEAFANLLLWLDAADTHLLAASAAILAASLVIYVASALLAARLYETREL